MTPKKANYFVPIQAAFLFDTFNLFKCQKTVWVYIYLKLKFSGILAFADTPEISIDKNEICSKLKISNPTVYRILDELEKYSLIVSIGDKYLFNSENELIKILKENSKETFPTSNAFFEIYNNFFLYVLKLTNDFDNVLYLYYYLKFKNQHYLHKFSKVNFSEKLTTRRIAKDTKASLSYLQARLNELTKLSFIERKNSQLIATFSEKEIMKS